MNKEKINNALWGFVLGDAIGVPFEFFSKDKINIKLIDFYEGGKHSVPKGAWSDDSSMMLCLIETLIQDGLNFDLYSKKIVEWALNGYMTPIGRPFGLGRTTFLAISKLRKNISYKNSGDASEKSNGNGALMRILPLVFELKLHDNNKYSIVETCTAITHAHDISKIASNIYLEYFQQLIFNEDKLIAYKNMQVKIKNYYKNNNYLKNFDSILEKNIFEENYDELSGYGYVISTLEVVLHCFINGNSYEDCILKAINIGNDTDTNAALTGALAGYFYNDIPLNLKNKIIENVKIQKLFDKFIDKLK